MVSRALPVGPHCSVCISPQELSALNGGSALSVSVLTMIVCAAASQGTPPSPAPATIAIRPKVQAPRPQERARALSVSLSIRLSFLRQNVAGVRPVVYRLRERNRHPRKKLYGKNGSRLEAQESRRTRANCDECSSTMP